VLTVAAYAQSPGVRGLGSLCSDIKMIVPLLAMLMFIAAVLCLLAGVGLVLLMKDAGKKKLGITLLIGGAVLAVLGLIALVFAAMAPNLMQLFADVTVGDGPGVSTRITC